MNIRWREKSMKFADFLRENDYKYRSPVHNSSTDMVTVKYYYTTQYD